MTSRIPISIRAALLLLALLVVGCDALDEIELGQCGNVVLDAGEDCDGYSHPEGTSCGPPGGPNACRFVCEPTCARADVDCEPELRCPVGWGCGIDGVCRQPKGFATSLDDLDVPAGAWLAADDFDNDGRDDLAFLDLAALRVSYSRGRGAPRDAFQFATRATGYPEIVDVDRDGFRDVALPTREGLEVLRGSSEARLRPGVYPSLRVPSAAYHFARLELAPPFSGGAAISGIGDEALAMADFGFIRVSLDEFFVVGAVHSGTTEEIVGPLGAGQVDEATYAEELVAAFAGHDEVDVYHFTPTADPLAPFDATVVSIRLGQGTVTGPGSLPSGVPEALAGAPMGARLVHANPPIARFAGQSGLCCNPSCTLRAPGDEHLDVAVSTTVGLQIAYGLGDGSFHSNPCTLEMGVADQFAGEGVPSVAPSTTVLAECEPLVVAQLDGDGVLDVVTPSGVWLSTFVPNGEQLCGDAALPAEAPVTAWVRAEVGDFNADGSLDVVAFNFARGDLDFLFGTDSSAVGRVTVPRVEVNAGAPRVGDFDGDGADDVAVLAEPNAFTPYVQELSIAWGEPGSAPELVQLLGEVPLVVAMGASSQRPTAANTVDDYDDLAIATYEAAVEGNTADPFDVTIRFGNLLGRPDRQMTMPFKPSDLGEESLEPTLAVYSPHAVVSGRFEFADPGERALATVVRFEGGFVDPVGPSVLAVALTSSGTTAAPEGTSTPIVEGDVGPLEGDDVEQRYRLAAVDLGRGTQEPIVFEFLDGVIATKVHAPRFEPASWDVPPAAELAAVPLGANVILDDPTSALSVSAVSLFVPNAPVGCDLGDPEGEHLLITMVEEKDHPFISLPNLDVPIPVEKRTALYVFSPAALRAVQQGAASVAPSVVIADDGMTTGVACMDVTGDGRDEVVMASLQLVANNPFGSFPVVYDVGFRLRLHATRLGADGVGLEPLTTLTELDEDVIGDVQRGGIVGVPMQGMVSGDVDGDGVQDLIFGGFDTTLVLYGEAVNP